MSCYRPLEAFRTPAGEVKLGKAPGDCRWLELPCGRCIGCKLDRARSWTIRIMHEAQLYDSNLCLTLTYSDACLPESLSLEYPHFQGFMKRLRFRLAGDRKVPDGGRPIRFFVAGEYGDLNGRPHWHAILFNCRFPDMRERHDGYFTSLLAEALWEDRGSVLVDRLSSAGAAYVAGYTLKKCRDSVYRDSVLDRSTGELSSRRAPFVVMSRRPGIGGSWFQKFGSDLFPQDFAVAEGQRFKVPRYYLTRYQREADSGVFEAMMERRYLRASECKLESTPERRAVREEVAWRRSEMFSQRGL